MSVPATSDEHAVHGRRDGLFGVLECSRCHAVTRIAEDKLEDANSFLVQHKACIG